MDKEPCVSVRITAVIVTAGVTSALRLFYSNILTAGITAALGQHYSSVSAAYIKSYSCNTALLQH